MNVMLGDLPVTEFGQTLIDCHKGHQKCGNQHDSGHGHGGTAGHEGGEDGHLPVGGVAVVGEVLGELGVAPAELPRDLVESAPLGPGQPHVIFLHLGKP
nr:hypothetical protein [Herbidospora sakaeratensis]